MNHVATYIAIYRNRAGLPVALFLDEKDANEWHANPEVYSNCRRKVIISPTSPPVEPNKDTEAERILRILVSPGDEGIGQAIEDGRKLLNIP